MANDKWQIFQKLFKGQSLLEEVQSPINDQIQVIEDFFGGRKLIVGRISQSGGMVEKVWKPILRDISNLELGIGDCLLLGLGAGTAAKLVSKFFPGVKMTGIEIDPEMVKLGKKYFGLGEIKNLEIKISDAIKYVKSKRFEEEKFDLILIDLYLGDRVVEETEDLEFLKNIKKLLSLHGLVVFNRLDYGKNMKLPGSEIPPKRKFLRRRIKKTENFEANLRKIFSQFEAKKISTNKLFLCRK